MAATPASCAWGKEAGPLTSDDLAPIGQFHVLGDAFPVRARNPGRNLAEGRTALSRAVLARPGSPGADRINTGGVERGADQQA